MDPKTTISRAYLSFRACRKSLIWGILVGSTAVFLWLSIVSHSVLPKLRQEVSNLAQWPSHGTALAAVIFLAFLVLALGWLLPKLRKLISSFALCLPELTFALGLVISIVVCSSWSSGFWLLGIVEFGAGIALSLALSVAAFRKAQSNPLSFLQGADRPIRMIEEDLLNRKPTVGLLADVLTRDDTPIISLEAPFGDGKSSILNLLDNQCKSEGSIIVRITSWLPGNEQSFVALFFASIRSQIAKYYVSRDISLALMKSAKVLSELIPKVGASLRASLPETSISDDIDRLKLQIERIPTRLIVLIDDVDRMHGSELEVLFKLLRGVTEMRNVGYVCAFDRTALVKLLAAARDIDDELAEQYLEKFFPLRVVVPSIDPDILTAYIERKLSQIISEETLLSDSVEKKEFDDIFWQHWNCDLKTQISNLRKINSLCTRISITIKHIKTEVNFLDFVLLEVIRSLSPRFCETLFRNRRYFYDTRESFSTWSEGLLANDEDVRAERKQALDQIIGQVPEELRDTLKSLLWELFPIVAKAYGQKNFSVRSDERTGRRICHPSFFPRYFIFEVQSTEYGERALLSFIDSMNSTEAVDASAALFVEHYRSYEDNSYKQYHFCCRVGGAIDRFNDVPANGIVLGICKMSELLAKGDLTWSVLIKIITDVGRRIKTVSEMEKYYSNIIEKASSESLAVRIFSMTESEKPGEEGDAVMSVKHSDLLRTAFRKRMAQEYRAGERQFGTDMPSWQSWSLWAKCGVKGTEEVQSYLVIQFRLNIRNYVSFASSLYELNKYNIGSPLELIKILCRQSDLREFDESLIHCTEAEREALSYLKNTMAAQQGQQTTNDDATRSAQAQ
jgi:hypothetical protein